MSRYPRTRVRDYEFLDSRELQEAGRYKVPQCDPRSVLNSPLLPTYFKRTRDAALCSLPRSPIHARMSHPNIDDVLSPTQLDGKLIMTELGSEHLAARRELGVHCQGPKALSFLSQVLSALAHCPRLGIVHRAITPLQHHSDL